ncbi:alpha-glucosidase (family GH31 glycosyl hydrolase) [Phyllobacterium sp. 1468]|uniref:TIM-barrel domain-containing protein n=1 Tax=Phyllobacterium sp. 1468 TaxID=2817759 RepID=UPI00285FDDAA|nr:TIM-barrel domain-containing protein [Phyllobacterium sp. 1468]MDR6631471.1 alpha-glucosidase (family GH31 glycosyl hydrolase) [Phyllobacterium sp. 1468]
MILRKTTILGAVGCALLAGCKDDKPHQAKAPPTENTGTFTGNTGEKTTDTSGLTQEAEACTSSLPAEGWVSKAGLHYQVSAVDPQIVRIRIGKDALPEDASWAVLQDARKPLGCATGGSEKSLKTAALTISASGEDKLSVADAAGTVLWQDADLPRFNKDGSFVFSGAIPKDSHFYGLGDKTDSIDKSGKSYIFWNSDTPGFRFGQDPLYRTLPFFIRRNGNSYSGYFLDNTWRSTYDFGKSKPGTLDVNAAGGGIDYYVIAGASPKEILSNYAKLTGTTPLPALWSLGWQQSHWGGDKTYDTSNQVIAIAKKYRDNRIPADAVWLDIQFQQNNYPFTISDSFAPFDTFVKTLSDINFKVVPITDLHIAADKSGNYYPYTYGHDHDYFVHANKDADKDKKKDEYADNVWPHHANRTQSVFPDFTSKPARDWWGTLFKELYETDGVAGIWNDMDEPSVFNGNLTMPDDNIHKIEEAGFKTRDATHKEIHNVFGMQNHRGTFEGLLKLKPEQRPFVMTRASYAGGQRYGVTWTGDNLSTWQHLRVATNQITGLGLSGFHSGADIGGFQNRGDPTPALLTRWMEIGSFYPISRVHFEKDKSPQEPWENGTNEDIATRTRYIRNRYTLMPYLYTAAEETSRTGTPMLRRMFLEFPDANAPGSTTPLDIAAETQFMVGGNLLVAPSPIEQGFVTTAPAAFAFGKLTEAESADFAGGARTATDHTGYTGRAFVAGLETAGAQIGFTLTGVPGSSTTAQSYDLKVKYANGMGDTRTMSVLVDGKTAGQIPMPKLSNWNQWGTATFALSLTGGDHKIEIVQTVTDSGHVNFDSLIVGQPGAVFPAGAGDDMRGGLTEAKNITAPYDVLLPPGKWFDYWTGKALAEPASGTASSWAYKVATSSLEVLPVYVRAGSIIPRLPDSIAANVQSTVDVAKADTLQLDIYPGEKCQGSVYTDDGSSFAFRKGVYYRRGFTCTLSGKQATVSFGAVEGTFKPGWTKVKLAIAGTSTTAVVNEAATIAPVVLPLQ